MFKKRPLFFESFLLKNKNLVKYNKSNYNLATTNALIVEIDAKSVAFNVFDTTFLLYLYDLL